MRKVSLDLNNNIDMKDEKGGGKESKRKRAYSLDGKLEVLALVFWLDYSNKLCA